MGTGTQGEAVKRVLGRNDDQRHIMNVYHATHAHLTNLPGGEIEVMAFLLIMRSTVCNTKYTVLHSPIMDQ